MNRKKIYNFIVIILAIFIFGTLNVNAEEEKKSAKLAIPLKSIIDSVPPLYNNGPCPNGFKKGSSDTQCYSNYYTSNIKKIKSAKEMDTTKNTVLISSDDSDYDVYIWQDSDILYYYTDADSISLDDNTLLPKKCKTGTLEHTCLTFHWEELTEIDLSKFDTSNVTNMKSLFYNCQNLEILDISNFDMSNVTNTSSMISSSIYDVKPKIIKSPKNMGDNIINLEFYYFDGSIYKNQITSANSNKELSLVYAIVDSSSTITCDSGSPCVIKYLPLDSEKYGDLPTLYKDGYTFEGWYKRPYYYNEEKIISDTLLSDEYIISLKPKFRSKTTNLAVDLHTFIDSTTSASGYENRDCPAGQIRVENSTNQCYNPFQYGNFKNFLNADKLDTSKTLVKISETDSLHDVYVWAEGETLYYYSDADIIYLKNADIRGDYLYRAWSKLENIDLSKFDTSRIDDISNLFRKNNDIKRLITPKLLVGNAINLPVTLYDTEFQPFNYVPYTLKEGTVLSKKYIISFENLDLTKNILYGMPYGELPIPKVSGYDFLGWYKDSNYETQVSSDMIFDDSSDIVLHAKLKPKTASILNANTVSFKDNLSLNFLVELDDEDIDGTYVKFKYNHYGENKEVIVPIDINDKNGKYYRFRCELTASEMMIPVTAELYLKDTIEPISTFTRSIRDYIISGLNNPNASAAEKKLFRATLNYGGYTQKRFNYNGAPYAYEDYKDDVSNINVSSDIFFIKPEGYINGVKYIGSSVFFRNAPYVRYYFELEDGEDISNYILKIDGIQIEPTKKDNRYYIESVPSFAYQLDQKQRVIVMKNDSNVMGFNYSIIKWAEIAVENTTNENERNMAKSMYAYYLAAKEFVESNS